MDLWIKYNYLDSPFEKLSQMNRVMINMHLTLFFYVYLYLYLVYQIQARRNLPHPQHVLVSIMY